MPAPTASSLIDRLDDEGRPIGLVPRGQVFEEQANFRTVHVFVFNSTGDMLIQQLGSERDRHPLKWGSSVAAYPHAGEPDEQAARRRLWEEVGSRASVRLVGRTVMDDSGCRKFITLFTALAPRPRLNEPRHIQAIAFRPLRDVTSDAERNPEAYTDTFRHLLMFFTKGNAGTSELESS